MPAFVRGFVVCDGCGKTANASAEVSARDGVELWWDLPKDWLLYARGRATTIVYCSTACRPKTGAWGYPDQIGRRKSASTFDVHTLDKVYELIESAACGAGADNILAAIEAVLTAWRRQGVAP